MYEIFLDMDGVLVDLEGGFHSASGFELKPGHNMTPEKLWEKALEVNDFWLELDKTHDADDLVDFCEHIFDNVNILSAPQHLFHDCAEQKNQWVERHYSGRLSNVHIVPRKEKYLHAHKKAILIDDYIKNIEEWEKAGGIGILHTTTKETIKQLNKYF